MQLEHLQAGDWDTVRRNFERLRDSLDTGGRSLSMRSGADTTTFPGGSSFSNTKSVTHGLGKAPTSVLITPFGSVWVTFNLLSIDDTQFTVQFQSNDTSFSPAAATGQSFSWEVKG